MLEERNADSVLFKIDALQEMAKAQAEAGRAQRQLARLAAPTPQSETGSGLIDLKSLGASPPGPGASAADGSTASLDAPAGSSGAMSQSHLLSSSTLLDASSTSPAPNHRAPSRLPLVILSVLAVLALLAAVGALVLRG